MTFQLPCQIFRQFITKETSHNPERLIKTLYQINYINKNQIKTPKTEKADYILENGRPNIQFTNLVVQKNSAEFCITNFKTGSWQQETIKSQKTFQKIIQKKNALLFGKMCTFYWKEPTTTNLQKKNFLNPDRTTQVLTQSKPLKPSKLVPIRRTQFSRNYSTFKKYKFPFHVKKKTSTARKNLPVIPICVSGKKTTQNYTPMLKRLKKLYSFEEEQNRQYPKKEKVITLPRADDNLKLVRKKLPKFKFDRIRRLGDWNIPKPKKKFDDTKMQFHYDVVRERDLPVCRLYDPAGLVYHPKRKRLPSFLASKSRKIHKNIDKVVQKRGQKIRESFMPRLDDVYWLPRVKKLPSLVQDSIKKFSTVGGRRGYCSTSNSNESKNSYYPRIVIKNWPARVKKSCLKKIYPAEWEKMPAFPFSKESNCYNPRRQKRKPVPLINFKAPVLGFINFQSEQAPKTVHGLPIPKMKGLPKLRSLRDCEACNKLVPCQKVPFKKCKRVEPPNQSFLECKGEDYVKPLSECHEYVIEKKLTPWPDLPKICPPNPPFDSSRSYCRHYVRKIKDPLQMKNDSISNLLKTPCGNLVDKKQYHTAKNDINLSDYISKFTKFISKKKTLEKFSTKKPSLSWGFLNKASMDAPKPIQKSSKEFNSINESLFPETKSPEQLEKHEVYIVPSAPNNSMQKKRFSKTVPLKPIKKINQKPTLDMSGTFGDQKKHFNTDGMKFKRILVEQKSQGVQNKNSISSTENKGRTSLTEPNFGVLFAKNGSFCIMQKRTIGYEPRETFQSKHPKFKKHYLSTLESCCNDFIVSRPPNFHSKFLLKRTKKRKCCANLNVKKNKCKKRKKCIPCNRKKSICKLMKPCAVIKPCHVVQKPTLFERIKNYFKARPNCPTPEEAKQKELRDKAEAAAKAAGVRICEKKPDPCAGFRNKNRKFSTFPIRSYSTYQKLSFQKCRSTFQKCSALKTFKTLSTHQEVSSAKNLSKPNPKYSTFQKRKNLPGSQGNSQALSSPLTKTTTKIVPVTAPKFIGKMYQVKLSKIGVKNKLTTKQIEEEPYTYCQICRIVPRNGTSLH